MARYEFQDGKSSKFWQIDLDGDTFTVRYGRIGSEGVSSSKVFADPQTAEREATRLTKAKLKKGYELVDSAPASAPARGPEAALEEAIFADPEDLKAWAAYGAWLSEQGDARGELVDLEIKKASGGPQEELQNRIDALIAAHRAEWLDASLIKSLEKSGEQWQGHVLELQWRFGFLHRAKAKAIYDWEGPNVEALLKSVLKSSASRFISEIAIGMTDPEGGETTFQREILALAKGGKRPSVRRLYVGDFEFPDETEISWTEVGNIDKVYPVFPNLQWLKVQGGGIQLGKLAHSRLESLIVNTGGLPREAAVSIAKADLPNLTELEVWFGADEYGGDSTVGDIAGLFTAAGVPKLKRLGLMNAEFTNDLPAALVGTPLLAQIEALDLSMGTMTTVGAEALLEHAEAFMHITRLSVDDNMLSEGMLAKLRERFGRRLHSSEQRDDDEDWRYVSVGE